jgi:nanoRNase/pAp phosphatase (c-di-AMP/oligoRNAs hydrolase)
MVIEGLDKGNDLGVKTAIKGEDPAEISGDKKTGTTSAKDLQVNQGQALPLKTLWKNEVFSKSDTLSANYGRLIKSIGQEDTLAVLINADPDAMASAVALKRLLWRKARKILIYHINTIQRGDNLAFIRIFKINQQPIRHLNPDQITKWALIDSQPNHAEQFMNRSFDIIIDHHPVVPSSKALFLDIRETYGATSTIMTEYLIAAKIRPSQMLATALFYGIKTDTDGFIRDSISNDISAFRYLYRYANMNIVKKIETSGMIKKMLPKYKIALDRLIFLKKTAFVHMGKVENPDILVILADFFLRLAEVTWSVVSGIFQHKLVIIIRKASFRGDAGRTAQRLFGRWGALAGGRKDAARAEIALESLIPKGQKEQFNFEQFVMDNLKEL